ncbi:MAG: MMPL family transporter [Clostridia bacterium]
MKFNLKMIFNKTILIRVLMGIMTVLFCFLAVLGFMNTKINYKLTEYLDPNADSMQGLKIVNEEFGGSSYARVMLKNIEIKNAGSFKAKLAAIEGVRYTLWLDDIVKMVTEPINENIGAIVAAIKKAVESITGEMTDSTQITEFLDMLSKGASTSEVLEFIDKNPIILDFVDLIVKYYFNGAINLSNYYDAVNKNALIEIYFLEDDYSDKTDKALNEIMSLCSSDKLNAYLDGTAVMSKAARETTLKEAFTSTLIAVPLIIIVLLLSTTSFFEPVLFLIVIGLSVLFNMGSNIAFQAFGILPNGISFVTNSMAMALQMAISMDYSIFLLHKYREEIKINPDKKIAIKNAVKHSLAPISASCLTTVAGFAAISFMKFGIGKDIGLVFAKGIIISFLCAMLVMPVLISMFDKLLEKGKHRNLMPSGNKIGRFTTKFAIPIVLVVALIGGFCFTCQDQEGDLNFMYGESSIGSGEGTKSYNDNLVIKDCFGTYNPVLIIIPKTLRNADKPDSDTDNEAILVNKLKEIKYEGKKVVTSIMAYKSLVKPGIGGIMPEELTANFDSKDHTRIVVNVNADTESKEAFEIVKQIKSIVSFYTTNYYLTGSTIAAMDMKTMITSDYDFVNLLAVIAVAVIIMFMFKSIILPILLVSTIEIGIFINMAIASIGGAPIAFLGYLVVSLIQLGATIDYAILYSKNYVDMRKTHGKLIAMRSAISQSIGSVLTSSLILCVAGFTIGIVSTVAGVAQIGIMIGLGALISAVLVLGFLPPLLYICDHYIPKLSIGLKFVDAKLKS